MRIDHIAYQRATRVATIGFALQFAIFLVLFLFGRLAGDTTILYGSAYAVIGLPVWISLIVIFNQHKLERLEALETDELQAQRAAGLGSAFDEGGGEFHVAARRLRLMHKWLMPIVSWMVIVAHAALGFGLWWWLNFIKTPEYLSSRPEGQPLSQFEHLAPESRGWGLAICLGIAAVSFICSRFVAGMAKQEAWQNLRGGAGYMVGNALVTLGVAVGIIFTYFNRLGAMEVVTRAILAFMIVFAAETFLNFILNLYRPRRVGEVPRPAFDSRLLSLLSAPDSIVRSINEAVNYQFGFDITSSWGYQLLLRATRRLAIFAVIVLVLLNCVVVVEPHQRAVRLRGGAIVGEPHASGIMLKWPWPLERAEVIDVARIRHLPLTVQLRESAQRRNDPVFWTNELDQNLGIEPFIVRTTSVVEAPPAAPAEGSGDSPAGADIGRAYALVEGEFILHYRIRADEVIQFLEFATDEVERRHTRDMRERTLRALALREVTQHLSRMDLDRIVSQDRSQMVADLRDRVQSVLDAHGAGVDVLMVSNPWIRPAGTASREFERLSYNLEQAVQIRTEAESVRSRSLTAAAGTPEMAERIIAALDALDALRRQQGDDAEAVAEQERAIEALVLTAGGEAANRISQARSDLWLTLLGAEARLEELKGRQSAYRTHPGIYREWLIMDALMYSLYDARKYIVGIDERALSVDLEMLQDDETFVFEQGAAEAANSGGTGQ
jgi:membrane protease subunit HflK